MEIKALGYVGLRTTKLDDWAAYGSQYLGMQLVDRSASSLTFRMDDRRQLRGHQYKLCEYDEGWNKRHGKPLHQRREFDDADQPPSVKCG